MLKKNNILEKSEQDYQLKTKTNLVEKIKDLSSSTYGEALYFRPFGDDDLMIEEIAQIMNEKKSAVAQKLLHLVLRTAPRLSMRENRQIELLEWLVENAKHRSAADEHLTARIERLEEHAGETETILKRTEESSHFIKMLVMEIYGLTTICVTFLNQIFTRLVEYFSPVEIEKKNSVEFANRNVLGLIKHALSELEKIAAHHHLSSDEIEPEMLYLFTKIDILKTRLLTDNISFGSEQN